MKLVFILIACIYSVSTETVDFIQQPKTDKECYEKGENGTLILSYQATGTTPLDWYKVVLTTNPEGTGGVKSNGTELNFYDTTDRDTKHARFRVTMSSVNRTMEYRLDVSSLELHDETFPLYASIIKSHSGEVVNVSSGRAKFHIETICPQRPQPTTSSMTTPVTTASSDNVTSKGNIPAKPAIPEVFCTSFYILLPICLLVIFSFTGFILYWFCIRQNPRGYTCTISPAPGTPMSPRLRNGNMTCSVHV